MCSKAPAPSRKSKFHGISRWPARQRLSVYVNRTKIYLKENEHEKDEENL